MTQHKPPKGPNVEPKIDIILRFPAVRVLLNEENNPGNDYLMRYNVL